MVMSTNTYDPSEFPAFAVTVDVVVLTMAKGRLQVLLVQRGVDPFAGLGRFPGGFKRREGPPAREPRPKWTRGPAVTAPALLRRSAGTGTPGGARQRTAG